ncbi:unnamed protein product [Heligmosomoides polygyrus]|uniref:Uncharacterized protein n=1 Tax=Heligmosomoides polygyrus TaxID=6339 RepID=A0A3P8ARL5_HELPZ|nr:unnamed protein product [Heligmosomoides polygyrus]
MSDRDDFGTGKCLKALAVVQEAPALGSDGESVEVSPCTSDQTPTGVPPRYIVNVKMRQKPSRKWSEVRRFGAF